MQNYLDGIYHTYFKNQLGNKNNKQIFPNFTHRKVKQMVRHIKVLCNLSIPKTQENKI
jgi:hypothetical protein